MSFEETMDAIARGVEVLGIVTLVLGLAAASSVAGSPWSGSRWRGGLPDRPNRVRA
jgi:hypothetical protein